MHLKSLTLKGFKSFAQPTTFEFEPGVTAIVGPNGSGKSNVVDALAWVMGEQGAKQLRGGKMEDVIFAGSGARGPLGRAEVKLTIDNSDGALPIAYSEVQISRTLFRNGSSEYAINGESCRLLDVQELLSDSGLGREMHVIVGQGQLDAVLRATPEERRGFIEEAAGILKHRRRKERTKRKLDAMEVNLTRLKDLAAEVRRQLTPLGRQAEVARQAQAIQAEVRDAKARLLAWDVAKLRDELAELAKLESAQHADRIVLQERAEQKQLRIKLLEEQAQRDDLDAARRVTVELEGVQGKLRGLLSQANQRLQFLESQTENPEQIRRTSEEEVRAAAEAADKLAAELPALEDNWQQLAAATRKAQEALSALDKHISEQSELISKHDLRLQKLRGQVQAASEKHDAIAQEISRRETALAQAAGRLQEAEQMLADFTAQIPEPEHDAAALEKLYLQAKEAQIAFENNRDAVREELGEKRQEQAAVTARVAALTRALDNRDASAAVQEAGVPGIKGRVAEQVQVQEGFEQAVSTALGVLADALLAHDASAAQAALARAKATDLGRLTLVLTDPLSVQKSSHTAKRAAVNVPGLTAVNEVLTAAPAGVRALLAYSYIAADISAAQAAAPALAAKLGHNAYTIVTTTGEILTAATVQGGTKQAPGRIELHAELQQAADAEKQLTAQIAELDARFTKLREEVAAARTATDTAYRELRQADARAAETAKQRQKLLSQVEAAKDAVQREKAAKEQAKERLAASAAAQQEAARQLAAAEEEPRPMLDAGMRDELVQELEAARQQELDARLTLEQSRERSRAAAAQKTQLAEQYAAERKAALAALRRMEQRDKQAARARVVLELAPLLLSSCEVALAEARAKQHQAEAERAKHSQELTLLRAEESELRAQLQSITERVHDAELKSYERKLHLSSLLERAGSELGLVEEVLLAEYAQQPPAGETGADKAAEDAGAAAAASGQTGTGAAGEEETPASAGAQADTQPHPASLSREEQEARLARAEKQLQKLGRINPLALEEFAALEQRHKFLNEQLQDLTKTRGDLLKIIADLDERMETIFSAAFADTQRMFKEVFPVLFPGGAGDITLTDPGNMLETGIEMTVRPAGKKVERLSLLSGGERSLAAVAWLIAIFKARPSPFYIMDEVEAALDDANLGRLLQVFEELRTHSQLIVITHQKRTMEIADILYGVSMRQDGISAVVGQRVGESSAAS